MSDPVAPAPSTKMRMPAAVQLPGVPRRAGSRERNGIAADCGRYAAAARACPPSPAMIAVTSRAALRLSKPCIAE